MWSILRIVIALVLLIIIQYYFYRKVGFTFKSLFKESADKWRKIFLIPLLILLNLYPVILLLNLLYALILHQPVSFPRNIYTDYLLLYPFFVSLIIIVQSLLLFISADILRLIFYPFYKKYKLKLVPLLAKIYFAFLIFCILYVPLRIVYDYNNVHIRKVELAKENLPSELEGFRIAAISDIQADRYTDEERLFNFITAVNSVNPDLVLIAGDVITSTPDYIETAAMYIGKINATYGVYSCVGDHDNWAYRQDNPRSIREITDALKEHNVMMVDNDLKTINVGNSKIGITFITNTYVRSIPDDLLASLSESNHKDFKIFLTHQPRESLIQTARRYNYNLFLAGHTHGGQITFLFPFIRLSPTLFETKYVKGDFYFDNMLAVVSGGLGMSIAPVRYNSTPEVVLITLKKLNQVE